MSELAYRPRSSYFGMLLGITASLVFCAAIWAFNGYLADWRIREDQPGRFYHWQLAEPTFWSHATAWGGYVLHQVAVWALIYRAQTGKLKYTDTLKPINWLAMGTMASFITLHLVQTQFFYDGLAQDVSESSAQWSVILLLLIVILIENRRRGMTFGLPWGGFVREAGDVARKYHGYYFAWATIYTFWYHPTIFTSGHIIGFFYMFLLFVQGTLFFTRAHTNRYWTLTLEVLVMIHGVIVALMNDDGNWHMFGFGLAGIFVVTQAFGVGWRRAWSWALVAAYVLTIVWFYSGWGWGDFPKVFRILGGYYVLLPVLALAIVALHRLVRRVAST
jgi:hypothetical protein